MVLAIGIGPALGGFVVGGIRMAVYFSRPYAFGLRRLTGRTLRDVDGSGRASAGLRLARLRWWAVSQSHCQVGRLCGKRDPRRSSISPYFCVARS